jgi:hypothetical protein
MILYHFHLNIFIEVFFLYLNNVDKSNGYTQKGVTGRKNEKILSLFNVSFLLRSHLQLHHWSSVPQSQIRRQVGALPASPSSFLSFLHPFQIHFPFLIPSSEFSYVSNPHLLTIRIMVIQNRRY